MGGHHWALIKLDGRPPLSTDETRWEAPSEVPLSLIGRPAGMLAGLAQTSRMSLKLARW